MSATAFNTARHAAPKQRVPMLECAICCGIGPVGQRLQRYTSGALPQTPKQADPDPNARRNRDRLSDPITCALSASPRRRCYICRALVACATNADVHVHPSRHQCAGALRGGVCACPGAVGALPGVGAASNQHFSCCRKAWRASCKMECTLSANICTCMSSFCTLSGCTTRMAFRWAQIRVSV